MVASFLAFSASHLGEMGAGFDGSTSCPAKSSLMSSLENDTMTALTRPSLSRGRKASGPQRIHMLQMLEWNRRVLSPLTSLSLEAMPGLISHGTETIPPLLKLFCICDLLKRFYCLERWWIPIHSYYSQTYRENIGEIGENCPIEGVCFPQLNIG